MENKDKFIHSDISQTERSKSENFFLQQQGFSTKRKGITEPLKRLNDYDYNMLEESAYKNVDDETFKLEYKITKIEAELHQLEIQIQTAVDMNDLSTENFLKKRYDILINECKKLKENYQNKSLSAKFSGQITSLLKNKKTSLFENLVSKLPKNIQKVFEIKKSLDKLANITQNVDNLISSNTPYGEFPNKYEQLSKYIVKANSIQNEISKQLKK